jgi:NAD(P)H-flavin reductase
MAYLPEPSNPGSIMTDPMTPVVARVRRKRRNAPQVFDLEIDLDDGAGADLYRFRPGQFNMLTVFGIGEAPISVSSDPAEPRRLIHTIRAVGPVSTALTNLGPGAAIGLRGPFGAGWPISTADGRDVVILAGGLGLAPLRPVLYELLAHRERYGKIILLYGTRSPRDILFRSELEAWRRRLDIAIEVTVDHATAEWRGHVGVVPRLLAQAAFDPLQTIALVCGPEVMMRYAVAALNAAGVTDEWIYLSMERSMKCAVAFCGHCQFGPVFVCRDGPVFRYDRVRRLMTLKEI